MLALLASSSGYIWVAPASNFISSSFIILVLFEELGVLTLSFAAFIWLIRRVSNFTAAFVGALLFTILHTLVFIDVRLFSFFRFHVNGLVLNVLTTSHGLEATGISTTTISLFIIAIIIFFIGQFVLFRRLVRQSEKPLYKQRIWAIALAAILISALGEHIIFAVADVWNYAPILQASRAIPFYQWMTPKRQLRNLGYLPVTDDELASQSRPNITSLNYPRAALRMRVVKEPPNILMIVIDSMRAHSVDKQTMPKLMSFAQQAQTFMHCYSGGNATRFGIFSLFYGLYGNFWHTMLGARRAPVLLERIKSLGYQTAAIASAPLSWPEFRETVFVSGVDYLVDNVPGRMAERDRVLVNEFKKFIDTTEGNTRARPNPYFAFIFFDSTHAPFDFPISYRRGDATKSSQLDLIKPAASLNTHDRYLSALAYADDLTEQVMQIARQKDPKLSHTIILITGDHGQEFGEHGYYGHNSAFDNEQIRVPLVLYVPGMAPKQYEQAVSLLDVAPTLGNILGIENDAFAYSHGKVLFDDEPRLPIVSCGWDQCGMVDEEGVVVFGSEMHTSGIFEIRDQNYQELNTKQLSVKRLQHLREVLNGYSAFWQKVNES
ncbi:MAG: sulfatase-like hydrolase/transferase [Deltaproteobacteria bacterium]|nr:sulfatase-like hydrolase/transferase [Deltaproteobacteria bacterium]